MARHLARSRRRLRPGCRFGFREHARTAVNKGPYTRSMGGGRGWRAATPSKRLYSPLATPVTSWHSRPPSAASTSVTIACRTWFRRFGHAAITAGKSSCPAIVCQEQVQRAVQHPESHPIETGLSTSASPFGGVESVLDTQALNSGPLVTATMHLGTPRQGRGLALRCRRLERAPQP